MSEPTPPESELVISFLTLRKAIGYLGIAMPIVVRVGAYLFENIPSNTSISAYYYTGTRDIFVGTLFAIGVFMFCYRGYDAQDRVLTNAAGLCGAAIGLLPTEPIYHPVILARFPDVNTAACYQSHGPLGYHIYVVAAFFLIISYLTIFRFTKSDKPVVTGRKKSRNRIYVLCGVVMLASLAAIVLLKWASRTASIFWPETIAIVAFGVAWLTKGEAIMGDKGE
jgi:hypothetical protein